MTELELSQISFFTNLALEYGRASNLFWNFHIIVVAAALGWAVTSRSWRTGLSAVVCVMFAIAFTAFSLVNLYCQGILYDRMNAAISAAGALWEAHKVPGLVTGNALTPIGAEHIPTRAQAGYLLGNFFSEGRIVVFGLDLGVALIAAGLLSSWGRTSAPAES